MSEELKELLDLSEMLRVRIIKDCRITNMTFWNWRNGKTVVPFWAREKINTITNEIAGKEVFPN